MVLNEKLHLYQSKLEIASAINVLAADRTPFLFIISAFADYGYVMPLDQVSSSDILFDFRGRANHSFREIGVTTPYIRHIVPVSFEHYQRAFAQVQKEQYEGCSYLLNLTFPSSIETDSSLRELYNASSAPYRLLLDDQFVCCSPEPFIRIKNDRIYTFPMKGTISAAIHNAAEIILNDPKESAEHLTIVDLLRNDLSLVSEDVQVDRYRYLERVISQERELLQVSSQISGCLPEDWHCIVGDILVNLLPAGSVTGAPKQRTVKIIKHVENYDRRFYTGVSGIYTGSELDSTVLIRFIEKNKKNRGGYQYKSGGGITVYSNVEKEYQELQDKVYV